MYRDKRVCRTLIFDFIYHCLIFLNKWISILRTCILIFFYHKSWVIQYIWSWVTRRTEGNLVQGQQLCMVTGRSTVKILISCKCLDLKIKINFCNTSAFCLDRTWIKYWIKQNLVMFELRIIWCCKSCMYLYAEFFVLCSGEILTDQTFREYDARAKYHMDFS